MGRDSALRGWEGPDLLVGGCTGGRRASAWVGRIPARSCAVGGLRRRCRGERPTLSARRRAAVGVPAAWRLRRRYLPRFTLYAATAVAPAHWPCGGARLRDAAAAVSARELRWPVRLRCRLPPARRGRARQARRCARARQSERVHGRLAEQLAARGPRARLGSTGGFMERRRVCRGVRASRALRAWRGRQRRVETPGGGGGAAAAAVTRRRQPTRVRPGVGTASAAAARLSAGGARPRRRPRRSRRRPPTAHRTCQGFCPPRRTPDGR
jgi:hypothetical protein